MEEEQSILPHVPLFFSVFNVNISCIGCRNQDINQSIAQIYHFRNDTHVADLSI